MAKRPPLKIALIGLGYWGPNILRNLMNNKSFDVTAVVDKSQMAQEQAKRAYPHLKVFDDINQMLEKTCLDAVALATPPGTHAPLAMQCLERKIHVLVEKPLALNSSDGQKLVSMAQKNQCTLMVDHTFVYHPATVHLTGAILNNELGKLLYYDSTRVNLGGFQPETNVLWDLAPHDLSILDAITQGQLPLSVSVTGIKHFNSDVESLCYAIINYPDNFVAHLNLNWASPIKDRKIVLAGDKKMAIFDDNNSVEKLKIYDKSVKLGAQNSQFRVNYRTGDIVVPAIASTEPLSLMIKEFAQSIQTRSTPQTDGASGLRVIQILEAMERSMHLNGRPTDVLKPSLSIKLPDIASL